MGRTVQRESEGERERVERGKQLRRSLFMEVAPVKHSLALFSFCVCQIFVAIQAEGAPYQGDRDRDQEEETVVYNEQRRKTINM